MRDGTLSQSDGDPPGGAICRADIIALALNRLPPRYVCTPAGEMITKLDQATLQKKADALTALTQAAELVKASPRH